MNEQIHWLHRRLPQNRRQDAGAEKVNTLKANCKSGKFRHPGAIPSLAGGGHVVLKRLYFFQQERVFAEMTQKDFCSWLLNHRTA
ncbi:hypothetical protein [Desulfatirhabdium butyrativorans]|uniref:hypothetical protein n=1 Tax=Desulfatirhabdium butyrativorans TaxID=340467 RepID=UPI00146FA0F7|nr:hypothetical protein [Desulfatirhabdium butyrativorans]